MDALRTPADRSPSNLSGLRRPATGGSDPATLRTRRPELLLGRRVGPVCGEGGTRRGREMGVLDR